MTIYYAHSQMKYGTEIEKAELELIRRTYPDAKIINPAEEVDQTAPEPDIMRWCLNAIRKSDIVVFSSVNSTVGQGVFSEVMYALYKKKPVYYIEWNILFNLDCYELLPMEGYPDGITFARVLSHISDYRF
jgi:nucleoside 2-deoxyribosyltransferase